MNKIMKKCQLIEIDDDMRVDLTGDIQYNKVEKRKKTGSEDQDSNNQQTLVQTFNFAIATNNEQITSLKKCNFNRNPTDIFTLNGDCLREIFKYCSVPDLYNMCIASEKMKIAVLENGVRVRTIDFSELSDCYHILDVFKIFGQCMTNIKIGEKDMQYKDRKLSKFDEILRLISTYCTIDTLKFLNLQYYYGTKIKKHFLYAALPYFRSIESFSIKETDHATEYQDYVDGHPYYNKSINDIVERIVGNAINITSIEMCNLKISGRFFHLHHVRNLETLSLVGCNVIVPDGFILYLEDKPKLKSFKWENSALRGMDTSSSHSSNSVFELVTNNVPELEAFYYDPNESFINDENKYDSNFLFMHPDYKLLTNFRKLKVLSIYGLTVECLKVLTVKNTVQTLRTGYTHLDGLIGNPIDFSFLQNFSSLMYIKLTISALASVKTFNRDILANLPNLTECYLFFIQNDDDFIVGVVETSRRLSILNIFWRRRQLTTALYSKLLQMRLEHRLFDCPLVIKINDISMRKCLAHLGQNYRPDIIKICVST